MTSPETPKSSDKHTQKPTDATKCINIPEYVTISIAVKLQIRVNYKWEVDAKSRIIKDQPNKLPCN